MNSFHYVIAIPYGLETSGTVVFANRLCRQLTEWGFEVAVLHIGQPHHSSRTANHISFEHPNQMLNWIENDLQCDVIFGVDSSTIQKIAETKFEFRLRNVSNRTVA